METHQDRSNLDDQTNTSWPLVSVITVNYNQSAVTLDFLASLEACTYPHLEVFVVDNGSPNDRPDVISEKFPKVHLIKTGRNLGFAGGNNVAVKQAKGKYLLFINNDTEVETGFLEPMVQLLEQNPAIGMVSPKIHFYHHPGVFQFAGFTPISPVTIRNKAIGFGEYDKGQYDLTHETGSIFGAAMLVPMRVIQEVGLMTEVFFLYYEEHDWAERMKRAGFKVFYCGKSMVRHKESISTVKESAFQVYYLHRGRLIYSRRNTFGMQFVLSQLYLHFIAMPKTVLSYLLKRKPTLAKAVLKAVWWTLSRRSKEIHS